MKWQLIEGCVVLAITVEERTVDAFLLLLLSPLDLVVGLRFRRAPFLGGRHPVDEVLTLTFT